MDIVTTFLFIYLFGFAAATLVVSKTRVDNIMAKVLLWPIWFIVDFVIAFCKSLWDWINEYR